MKTTYRADELAHAWFHKSSPVGKVNGSRMASFEGNAFYSYSTVIARHGEHQGKPYVIRDINSFSSFTGRVQNRLHRAIPSNTTVFWFDGGRRGQFLNPSPVQLFECAIEQAAKCEEKAKRARANKAGWQAQAHVWLTRAQAVNSFFGLRRKVDEKSVERLRESAERERKKQARIEAERQEKLRRENQANYEAWIAGSRERLYFSPGLFPVAFRVEENELVSTLGARVPLEDAKRALRFVIRFREREWRRNGETCLVGAYQLDSVHAAGVIAGCHRITWAEIDRLSTVLLAE